MTTRRGKGYRNGPITVTRRILKLGNNSFYINLPQEFVKRHKLGKGDPLVVIAADNLMRVIPLTEAPDKDS